jgi:hypothetical protein
MECPFARWRKHKPLPAVKWFEASGATTTWGLKKRIIDEGILNASAASWQGDDAGVDVLEARLRAGGRQRLSHWLGRLSKEHTWVYGQLRLGPQLVA